MLLFWLEAHTIANLSLLGILFSVVREWSAGAVGWCCSQAQAPQQGRLRFSKCA